MMTNQEFLNGIYAKAEIVKRAEEKKQGRGGPKSRITKRFLPVMAFCILAITAIPLAYSMLGKPPAAERPPGAAPAQFAAPGAERSLPMKRGVSPMESPYAIAEGRVSSVEETDDGFTVVLEIETAYQGDLSGEIVFQDDKESGFSYEEGERGLFYLEWFEDGYRLGNGDYGKYRYLREENGEKIFEARDGSQLSEGILKQE